MADMLNTIDQMAKSKYSQVNEWDKNKVERFKTYMLNYVSQEFFIKEEIEYFEEQEDEEYIYIYKNTTTEIIIFFWGYSTIPPFAILFLKVSHSINFAILFNGNSKIEYIIML